jgi:hypothetical protein
MLFARTTSRRRFLAGVGGLAAAALAAPLTAPLTAGAAALPLAGGTPKPNADASRLAWVWTFETDGPPRHVRDTLARYGMGVMLKTHDGPDWMSTIGKGLTTKEATFRIARLAEFFETGGVPFHAWSVVTGEDPKLEAERASAVLEAGARSLVLDLESYEGFWRGTDDDATTFATELRRRRPSSTIATTVDSRPWEIDRLPLDAFSGLTDSILPQSYWSMFQTPSNLEHYRRAGYDPGPAGITPEFVVNTAADRLAPFGRPLAPIGDGSTSDEATWQQFLDACALHDAPHVSVWRFGVTSRSVLNLLRRSAFAPLPALSDGLPHRLIPGLPELPGSQDVSGP